MLVDVCCLLCDVCWLFAVLRGSLLVACRLLHLVRYLLRVACCPLLVGRRVVGCETFVFAFCYFCLLLLVVKYFLFVICCVSLSAARCLL